ncbi:hypothetical protein [Sphingomonas sp. URHD0057]|uniref:hypothetical protein n=1 Tax=Sphingomonas sp. URHD0057 TaxID=1380389 RepID=UPI00055C4119|nr:hypothetical protein [Sphingomonas sp. URHD0057]
MQQAVTARTPMHLWIVGFLALLWNGFGAYDYLMTRMRNEDYLASAMPGVDPNAMLAWIDGFPLWAQIGWGLGVWMGLLGAILLLVRSRWAVWSFLLSLIGALLGLGYQMAMAPPMPGGEGAMAKAMPVVVIVVAGALYLYARAMERKGVLR